MKIITVHFKTAMKEYAYFCPFDVEVGETLVVPAQDWFKMVVVARVQGVSRHQRDKASAVVVCKVDIEAWKAAEGRKDLEMEIKQELNRMKEEFDELQVFQIMAKSNPKVMELLTELRELDPEAAPMLTEGVSDETGNN